VSPPALLDAPPPTADPGRERGDRIEVRPEGKRGEDGRREEEWRTGGDGMGETGKRVEEGRWERDAAMEIEMREEAGDGGGTQERPTVCRDGDGRGGRCWWRPGGDGRVGREKSRL
jgi:hypothetical protein